jgi:hypothetical protein
MAAENEIMAALFARLASYVASPVLPVAWPNIAFTPPSNQRYLRAAFVPNLTNRALIDSDGPHQHVGLLQVSVMWTKGAGETSPRLIAGAIADHFACDLKLRSGGLTVRITKRPDVRDLMIEEAAIQIPVMVEWECWA